MVTNAIIACFDTSDPTGSQSKSLIAVATCGHFNEPGRHRWID
jgi:hypothetical protein